HLRTLAETALRRRDATGLHAAALALADNGLLDATLAEDIITGFGTATAIRLPENAASELLPIALRRPGPFLRMPHYRVSRLHRPMKNPGRAPYPVPVTDVSTRLSYADAEVAVDFYLFALVREPHEAWLSAAAHTVGGDPDRISRARAGLA